jgi:hypothetical protein
MVKIVIVVVAEYLLNINSNYIEEFWVHLQKFYLFFVVRAAKGCRGCAKS